MAGNRVDRDCVVSGIASGLTNALIAERCGCHPATVSRYRNDQEVQAEVKAARTARLRRTADVLADAVTIAAVKVRQIIENPNTEDRVIIAGLRALVAAHADSHDRSDLSARLDSLEALTAERAGRESGTVVPMRGR